MGLKHTLSKTAVHRLNRLTDEWTRIDFRDRTTTRVLCKYGLAEICPKQGEMPGGVRVTELGKHVRNRVFAI